MSKQEEIINDRKIGYTYKELMGKYNITSKGTISFIINKALKNKKNSFSN
jgi:Mor family transcriptional regulator